MMVGYRGAGWIVRFMVCLFLIASCDEKKNHAPYPGPGGNGGNNTTDERKIPESAVLNITSIGELNQGESPVNSHKGETERSMIVKDFRSYRTFDNSVLGGDYPIYPRMTRSASGMYILMYHMGNSSTWAGDETYWMTSLDLVNWNFKGKFNTKIPIKDDFGYNNTRAYAGPNILTLSNGDIISSVSYRAVHGYGGHNYRDNYYSSGIMIRRSTDGGISWDEGISIYNGMNWETHLVELPNGDIHCYFTNSTPRITLSEWPDITNNSGTAVVISHDGGKTWTYGGYVVRQLRDRYMDIDLYTDQMPVVIALNETGELAGAFESQMAPAIHDKTDYWISLAYSGEGNTSYPELTGNSLGPKDRVNSFCKGSSPFLVQFPSGETVLAYNSDNIMYLRMGDENARNFGSPMQTLPKKGFWPGLYVDGSHRMLASIGGSGKMIQLACYYLNHNISSASHSVSIDGKNDEWQKTDDALFLGAVSQAQATLRCSSDKDNLYFLVEVQDENLSSSDYTSIYLSSPDDKNPGAGSIKIQLDVAGLKSSSVYSSGWTAEDLGIEVVSGIEGTVGNSKDEDAGYLCEVKVPRSSVKGIKDGRLIVNFELFDFAGGVETVAPSNELSKWPVLLNLN